MNNDILNQAFDSYFGKKPVDATGIIADSNDQTYTYQKEEVDKNLLISTEFTTSGYLHADDNIDDVEQLSEILSKLLIAAWGPDWGVISPDLVKGEDDKKIVLPQIVVDVNNREVSEKTPIKPVLMETIKEVVDGIPTGDSILLYRQWFDCVIEFDIYGRTPKEVREKMNSFEKFIHIYVGYLKRQGISEMLFLKETSPRTSLNFVENIPMKPLLYYVKLERITPVRQSVINKINTEIGIETLSNEKLNLISQRIQSKPNVTDGVQENEFDIFSVDTGTIYDINES